MKKKISMMIGLGLIMGVWLEASSFLQDREREARRLLEEAKLANEKGDYDRTSELARKVSEYALSIEAMKEVVKKHNWLWYRIAYAKYLGGPKRKREKSTIGRINIRRMRPSGYRSGEDSTGGVIYRERSGRGGASDFNYEVEKCCPEEWEAAMWRLLKKRKWIKRPKKW